MTIEDSWFHDCYGCDFIHGRFGSGLVVRRNRFERALPCSLDAVRCGHQDLIELFEGQNLSFESNVFGVYRTGGAQLYLTGRMHHVSVVNNVFLGTDPKVPGYRSRVGLIIGSRGAPDMPRYVRVVNNTILTGARRVDGYEGSIRMSTVYWGVPMRERPLLTNNVIAVLTVPRHVCSEARASRSSVILRGHACSRSDRLAPAWLDRRGRPTAASTSLIDRANRRFAAQRDITGRRRGRAPDIGAYEYRGSRRGARR